MERNDRRGADAADRDLPGGVLHDRNCGVFLLGMIRCLGVLGTNGMTGVI